MRRKKSKAAPRKPKPESKPEGQLEANALDDSAEPDSDELVVADEGEVDLVPGEDAPGQADGDDSDLVPALDAETSDSSVALVPTGGRDPASVDPLSSYIREVRRFSEIDPEEEKNLARRYRESGDADAARQLITANLRLVVKLALMYRRALRNVMDLIQEGNIGLLEALKRYDPEQGVRFSTYASWWIKAYILKFLMDNARLVRVGTTNARRKLIYNLRREQRKLQSEGIDPTPKLLADRFGVSTDDVVDVDKALASRDISVDTPVREDSHATLAEVMPSKEISVDEQVAEMEIREKIDAAIEEIRGELTEREQAILDRRLVAVDPATLQELGDRFGVTREAMRQAEAKLKTKLAAHLRESLGDEIVLHFSR